MERPKFGKRYLFLRLEAGEVREWVGFTADEDGRGGLERRAPWRP